MESYSNSKITSDFLSWVHSIKVSLEENTQRHLYATVVKKKLSKQKLRAALLRGYDSDNKTQQRENYVNKETVKLLIKYGTRAHIEKETSRVSQHAFTKH